MSQTFEIPVVKTERLLLRGAKIDDFASFAATRANPEVTQYIGGKPLTEEESWTKLLRSNGLWMLLGFGYWTIEERETGAVIGEVGFADFKRDICLLYTSPSPRDA